MVAIAVLTVLLAIGLTFFTVTRLEVKTSTNVENSVRADLLADSAVSMAITFLKHDAAIHPSYTSLDHAWRTYFNGAWMQKKLWGYPDIWEDVLNDQGVLDSWRAMAITKDLNNPDKRIPEIFFTGELDEYGPTADKERFPFRPGGGGAGNLYVPRVETPLVADWDMPAVGNPGDANYVNEAVYPFTIPSLAQLNPGADPSDRQYMFPQQVVNAWADVDNDEDTLNDSVWIPMVADVNGGNVLDYDGYPLVPGDGADNDLDYVIDEPVSLDDRDTENEVFLYYGGNDGLDNDGDGIVDGPNANGGPGDLRWFLTAPLSMFTAAQVGAAQHVYATLYDVAVPLPGGGQNFVQVNSDPNLPWPRNEGDLYDGNHRWVDVLDNDYDLIHNKHQEWLTLTEPEPVNRASQEHIDYAYRISEYDRKARDNHLPFRVLTQTEFERLQGVREIHQAYLGRGTSEAFWRVKSIVEPVCEIIGRAAVLINDDASKVNLNAAGAHNLDLAKIRLREAEPYNYVIPLSELYRYAYNDTPNNTEYDFFFPASYAGPSTLFYRTDLMPQTGSVLSKYMWNMLTGTPQGWLNYAGAPIALTEPSDGDDYRGLYYPDVALPGYGMVDDDGNALILATNGMDDDGDGLVDEGVNPGSNLTPEQVSAAIEFAQRNGWFDLPDIDEVLGFNEQMSPAALAQLIYGLHTGFLEGVDEPNEYRQRMAYRNSIAEGKYPRIADDPDTMDTYDNNSLPDDDNASDNIVNEVGELGDHALRTREELKNVRMNSGNPEGGPSAAQIAAGFFNLIKPFVSLHSTDSEVRFKENPSFDGFTVAATPSEGIKLNYNFADAKETSDALQNDWNLVPLYFTEAGPDLTPLFLYGLKREDFEVAGCPLLAMGTEGTPGYNPNRILPFDQQLHAMQVAVNVRDAADKDYVRSTLTVNAQFEHQDGANPAQYFDYDPWWETITRSNPTDPLGSGDKRPITYTVAGNEGIRITEIMARPVRRIEAEMEPSDIAYANRDPRFDPNRPEFSRFWRAPIPANSETEPVAIQSFEVGRSTLPEVFKELDPANLEIIMPEDADGKDLPYWERETSSTSMVQALGPRSVMKPYTPYIIATRHDLVNDTWVPEKWPNVIEFVFKASPELPPGRYYLTLNTRDLNGTLSVVNPKQIYYAVKYVAANDEDEDPVLLECDFLATRGFQMKADGGVGGGSSIIEDVIEWCAAHAGPSLDPVEDFFGGLDAPPFNSLNDNSEISFGRENKDATSPLTGQLFLETAINKSTDEDEVGYNQDEAFTVTIPRDPTISLHVAICMDPDPTVYPPSGYPEVIQNDGIDEDGDGVANIDDGPEDAAGQYEADGVEVPLPALNFFEFSQEPEHEWIEIENTTGETVNISNWKVVIGQIDEKNNCRVVPQSDPVTLVIPDQQFLEANPPYNRAILVVSREDHFSEVAPTEDSVLFTNGIGTFGGGNYSNVTTPAIPGWDPINGVELPNAFRANDPKIILVGALPAVPLMNGGSEQKLAQLVLRGGILPNYPEHDGIDNDYDDPILSMDGVDNNGDEYLIETNGFDIDGDSNLEYPKFWGVDKPYPDPDDPTIIRFGLGEGVDEGRVWMDNWMVSGIFPFTAPGSYSMFPSHYTYCLWNRTTGNIMAGPDRPYIDIINFDSVWPIYHSPLTVDVAALHNFAWKEFMERRFYPGDNVRVTLIQTSGQNSLGIVDSVTYTERDVINRSINDAVPAWVGDPPTTPLTPIRPTLESAPYDNSYENSTLWPDNTMGIDFYRTLERKYHPSYNGDRFGTQNRWEATDGNYDDWAHDPLAYTSAPVTVAGATTNPQFFGTPLEGNAANINLAATVMAGFKQTADSVKIPNASFVSYGEAANVPTFAAAMALGPEPLNFDTFPSAPGALKGLRVGQGEQVALMGLGTSNYTTLSAGQASVHSLYPTLGVQDFRNDDDWTTGLSWHMDGATYMPPQPWSPVFLYPLLPPETNERYREINDSTFGFKYQVANMFVELPAEVGALAQFIYNKYMTPETFWYGGDSQDIRSLWTRWPIQTRTAMYVSGNMFNFDPVTADRKTTLTAAEALFVWDAQDGLENGEYDVYINTGGDCEFGGPNVSPLGGAIEQIAAKTPAGDTPVDIECFTDIDGDGRCWDRNASFPTRENLNRAGAASESFGGYQGRTADANGLIHYGVVRVQNSYLALDLRNFAAPGTLNRFAGIILAPKDRAPGRINVNTTEPRAYRDTRSNLGQIWAAFDPLMGLPAVMPETSPALNWQDYAFTTTFTLGLPATEPFSIGFAFRYTGRSFYLIRLDSAGSSTPLAYNLYRVVDGVMSQVLPSMTLDPNPLTYGNGVNTMTIGVENHPAGTVGEPWISFVGSLNGTALSQMQYLTRPDQLAGAAIEFANPTGSVGLWAEDSRIKFVTVNVQTMPGNIVVLDEIPVTPKLLESWTGTEWIIDKLTSPFSYHGSGSGTGAYTFYTGGFDWLNEGTTPPSIGPQTDQPRLPLPGSADQPPAVVAAADADEQARLEEANRLDRARRIELARPVHWDGRYYMKPADLITYNADGSPVASYFDPNDLDSSDGIDRVQALSNITNPQERAREIAWRFARLANQITTRSDVFEIIATVQTGYVIPDQNGKVNWRKDSAGVDDPGFVATAEKKTRTVYER